MAPPSPTIEPDGSDAAASAWRAPSIRTVVALTMIAPTVVLTVALIVIASVATRGLADRLGQTALREANGRVEAELRAYLGEAEQLGAALAALVDTDLLPTDHLERWPDALAQLLHAFPAVAIVAFARPDGEVVGIVNDPAGPLALRGAGGLVTERPQHSDDGRTERTYAFAPMQRPWYLHATQRQGADWTEPYEFVRRDLPGFDVGTSWTQQILGDDGKPLGVLSVDVTFGALDAFIASMRLSNVGRVAVVDAQGMLVADSSASSTDGAGNRRAAPASLAALLERRRTTDGDTTPLKLDGTKHLASVTRLPIGPRRDWIVVATVPQSMVRRAALEAQVRLAIVSAAALGLTLLASIWLGRRIADPVRNLRDHVQRVGAGQVSHPLDLRAAREFEQLSGALNVMARDLAERVRLRARIHTAGQVQRTLLPPADLVRPGLQLHARSRFCESIGGDYYDYIDLPERGAVLVAVGDVMGHGIDSALVMATARAALRSEVRRTESLGAMLIRINEVLLQGGAHGRFMTMFLMMVEPARRRIRWANAGHETGVLVRRGVDAIEELSGGDIPLGIDSGVVYFEHSMEDVPGEALLMVGTDGLRETLDPVGEAFGEDRMRTILLTDSERPLAEIADRIEEAIDAHRGPVHPIDDTTFVLARMHAIATTSKR